MKNKTEAKKELQDHMEECFYWWCFNRNKERISLVELSQLKIEFGIEKRNREYNEKLYRE
jgi:hypothetical protein